MNNNRCLICNRVIPEGRQVCPICERKATQANEIGREITSVFSVTPENAFCLNCKKKKCNGECQEFKDYIAGLRKESKGGRIAKKRHAIRQVSQKTTK